MRAVSGVIGFGAFFWVSMAAAVGTYTVKPVIGAANATLGTYAVEIVKDGEKWTAKRIRGGSEVMGYNKMEEYTKEIAAGMTPSFTTSEILLINPGKKLIYLGANEPGANSLSASELSRSTHADSSFECFVGLGSTSRRRQGYTACSSSLTKVSMNPVEAVFGNIFNVIFATLRTRKIVDDQKVLEVAISSGAIKAAEVDYSNTFESLKNEAENLVKAGSGSISKSNLEYYSKVYADQADYAADRVLFENAKSISKVEHDEIWKAKRLANYRNSYARLSDTATTDMYHQVFLSEFSGFDPDNVRDSVKEQIERINSRKKKEMTVIGNRVCHSDGGSSDGGYNVIGYIENTAGERLQIRVADVQMMVRGRYASISRLIYKDAPLEANSIFWDNYQGWVQC